MPNSHLDILYFICWIQPDYKKKLKQKCRVPFVYILESTRGLEYDAKEIELDIKLKKEILLLKTLSKMYYIMNSDDVIRF